jgi:hypothetical protein
VALELASRKHGLDALTSSQTEGLGNPHSVSHLQPNKPPARNPPLTTRPNRSRRAGPGTKIREHGLNVPKVNQTEGLGNPHSVSYLQPNKPPARNPPLSDATKSLQARGDRDQAPTQMVIHIIWENIPSGVNHTGPTTSRDIRTARADSKTAAQDEWPWSTLWYSVPDSVHCSRASVLPRLGLARDPAGVPSPHKFRTDHE